MKINQVAVQLYTVREHIKTPPDIARSLSKIRAIGYEAVQVSGMGPIDEAELAGILKNEGLKCCATHEGNILTEPEKVAERLGKLSCKHTAYPYPSSVKLDTLADVKEFAARLNRAGNILHDAGKALSYHNHNIEFRKFDGRPMLDILFSETDPRYLKGEIDTYWVQYGGGDPVYWCERLANRLPLLHMKDFGTDSARAPAMMEIGNGNLDWKRIVGAAERAGCEWFIVEQDTCPGDPFESLKISYEYIRSALCS